jgi:SAM-dependent methyltransferase
MTVVDRECNKGDAAKKDRCYGQLIIRILCACINEDCDFSNLRKFMADTLYDGDFYERHRDRSIESARIVAPLVMRLAAIGSVIDVGCGVGGWLRAFSENGVATVRGLDGNYVEQSKLYIPSECFSEIDLQQPLHLEGRYDLAVCLEVAEHLDSPAGGELVRALTDVAPLILFSAAVPGQGGIGHVNEQWPAYWRRLFDRLGFRMLDVIRPMIREDGGSNGGIGKIL